MRCGFARVRCDNCGQEYLLAFSCKRRHFCPSCHQKRVLEYGEWPLTDVLKKVARRHWVFSIPKRLRIYFMYDRSLLLKKEGRINDGVIENMLSWRHTGFHVHVDGRIWPEAETALGNLAKYIFRASFSQERMVCIPAEKSADGSAKVVYTSKDFSAEQTFDAMDWLARLVVHIPNKYEQLVRYVVIRTSPGACAKRREQTISYRRSRPEN